jgi:hypothetical protein
VAAPPAADEAPAAAEIAEPCEQAEPESEPDKRAPIYRWLDPSTNAEDATDLDDL